jgi:hypothetical protein
MCVARFVEEAANKKPRESGQSQDIFCGPSGLIVTIKPFIYQLYLP